MFLPSLVSHVPGPGATAARHLRTSALRADTELGRARSWSLGSAQGPGGVDTGRGVADQTSTVSMSDSILTRGAPIISLVVCPVHMNQDDVGFVQGGSLLGAVLWEGILVSWQTLFLSPTFLLLPCSRAGACPELDIHTAPRKHHCHCSDTY